MPDSVLNGYGDDPWLLVVQGVEGGLHETENTYLMYYLFSRALGSTSRSSAYLAVYSFDQVYRAV